MKENFQIKIVISIVMFFLIMSSLSPAQELSKYYDIDDIELKVVNNFLPQKLINTISPGKVIVGEKLDPNSYGPGFVEHMDDCIARNRIRRSNMNMNTDPGDNRHGNWVIPSRGATYYPYSGEHNVINKWGDTMMGITFPFKVDIQGAWFAGQGGGEAAWTTNIRVFGYSNDQHVQTTDWFEDIDKTPTWFAMNLDGVDRIVIEAIPVFDGGGWYAMDDFTYSLDIKDEQGQPTTVVLDFEDCSYKQNLKDTNYGGLIWETGTGSTYSDQHGKTNIQTQYVQNKKEIFVSEGNINNFPVNIPVTEPVLINDYQGIIRGDAESWSYPPDTCGAAGPNHFVEVVNRNFAVYDKSTGEELINILLGEFLPESNGDPRVLYDQYSERWFVIVCDFITKIFLAVSTSDDPTEEWFKCSFVVSQGSDAGKWPDYPTLGVDEDGIYTSAYMIGGGGGMSIFALDKEPLIASNPSLGDIYAFRELPYEGAIQPVHSFGTCEGEYFVSRASSTGLRIRLLTGLPSDPILTDLCLIPIPAHSSPPDAPALGSNIPLDTVGHRLMNAVYRDGFIWTAHCVNVDGRAASRWYKIDVENRLLDDSGTIEDPVMYYFFPTIMVNPDGDAIIGFSGSHSEQYAASYYTGRLASDPPGEMAPPMLLKEGEATYNLIDGYGRNRWGDYSLCSLDPVTNTLWTSQEYAHSHNESGVNRWGTWIGELTFNLPPTPPEIIGPNAGAVDYTYDFTVSSEDPDNDDIYYYIDWGDGDIEEWIGNYPSGAEVIFDHFWSEIGTYEINAKAKDDNNFESDWTEPLIINISHPPNAPKIDGPSSGQPGNICNYNFTNCFDPDGDNVNYYVEWGDGEIDEGNVGSSGAFTLSHSWNKVNEYLIKAKLIDEHGVEGNWGTFKVNIPRYKNIQINLFSNVGFSNLLQILKIIFHLLA
jgi:hypothetical protein